MLAGGASMTHTIDVRTSVYPEGLIITEVIEDLGIYRDRIMRQVVNTKDQQVREALIKMGWTPPPNSRDSDT